MRDFLRHIGAILASARILLTGERSSEVVPGIPAGRPKQTGFSMPYEITKKADYLLGSLSGVVSADDLHGMVNETEALEETTSPVPNRIVDLTTAEKFDFDSRVIVEIAERRRARPFPNSFKSALIAERPVARGLARMFQILNDHPQIEIRILGSVREAEDWFAGKPVEFRR